MANKKSNKQTNKEVFNEFSEIYNQIITRYKEVAKFYYSLMAELEIEPKFHDFDKELEALIEDKPYYPNIDALINQEDQEFILAILDKNQHNCENVNYQILAKGLISKQIILIDSILSELDMPLLNESALKRREELDLLLETFEMNNDNLKISIEDLKIDLINLNKAQEVLINLKSKIDEE